MDLLVLSIVALAAGPLLVHFMGARSWATMAIDGFVLTALCGLVLVFILPQAFAAAGFLTAPAFALGIVLPTLAERWLDRARRHHGHHHHHQVVSALALVGLALHALPDGVALLEHGSHGGIGEPGAAGEPLLAVGVVLHHLPLSLVVWSRLRARLALLIYVAIGVSTCVGFFAGDAVLALLSSSSLGIFQALVAGSLVHVAIEPPISAVPQAEAQHGWAGVGSLLGVGALVVLAAEHPVPGVRDPQVREAFVALATESALPLLLGYAAAGVIQALLTNRPPSWLMGPSRWSQAWRGMVFGLPLPLCSCGVIPVYRTLVSHGAPVAAAFAFLIATPEIGLDAFFLSWSLLGSELALLRLGAAAVVALGVGLFLGGSRTVWTPETDAAPALAPQANGLAGRLREGLRFGFGELFEHTMPWVVMGLLIAALAVPLLDAAWITALPSGLDVVLMAAIGLPIYVCATGATPMVAMLMAKGLSAGAAIAFLIVGPATNVTTIGIVTRLHGRRAAILFALVVPLITIAVGLAVNALPLTITVNADLLQAHRAGALDYAALTGLCALTVLALLRRGPRGLLGELSLFAESEAEDVQAAHCAD